MRTGDWLVGADRHALAVTRIYDAATDLIARHGWDGFDLDMLGAAAHCSRATIYRHVGGKTQIREAVLQIAAERIAESVRATVDGLSGHERLITAMSASLDRVRADPLNEVIVESIRGQQMSRWLTESPMLAAFACELCGIDPDDAAGGAWVVRIFASLLAVSSGDPSQEREMLRRFVAPVIQLV